MRQGWKEPQDVKFGCVAKKRLLCSVGLAFDIARRLARPGRSDTARQGKRTRRSVMERVAVWATAVSVAVVMITLSVVAGFKHDLRAVLTGAAASVSVTSPQSRGVISRIGIDIDERLERLLLSQPDVCISRFTSKEGVIKNDDNMAGTLLKGVDMLYDWSFFADRLTAGRLPRIGGQTRTKDLLLSEDMARRMDIGVDSRVEMIFVDDNGEVRRDRFAVSGLYSTGVEMIDAAVLLTDMRNVQRLCDWPQEHITGYEIWCDDPYRAVSVADSLNEALTELYLDEGIDAEAFSIEAIYPEIFGWLATHDVNAAVMIAIMIVVALLNMTTAMLILVLERSRMIGELRAMGMTNFAVGRVFFWRAAFIALSGTARGAVAGIVICALQYYTGLVTLPSDGYFLTQVPVAFCWGAWGASLAGAMLVIMAAMALPAAFVSRISPAETIRYI